MIPPDLLTMARNTLTCLDGEVQRIEDGIVNACFFVHIYHAPRASELSQRAVKAQWRLIPCFAGHVPGWVV